MSRDKPQHRHVIICIEYIVMLVKAAGNKKNLFFNHYIIYHSHVQ